MTRLSVLMISKASVTALYREKQRQMAAAPGALGVNLTLVVPPAFGGITYEPDPADTYPIVQLPLWWGRGQHHLHLYRGLARAFRAAAPDLVHIDEEHYSLVTWAATRLAARAGVPSIFFTWQNLYKHYPWPVSAWEAHVLRQSPGAIAGNQEAAAVLSAKGFRGPVAVIPQFGTDPERFQPLAPAAREDVRHGWGVPPGSFAIGYVGRLVAEKGLDVLATAAGPLLREHPSWHLVLVGDGPWRAAGRAWQQREGLDGQVHWVPRVPSPAMPAMMGALDVLVLPSLTTPRWKEQFGRVLVEAMASGVPVIGSDSGEIPAVIGGGGLIVPEGDPGALGEALAALARDPAAQGALARAGRARVLAHYTPSAIAANTVQFYQQVYAAASGRVTR